MTGAKAFDDRSRGLTGSQRDDDALAAPGADLGSADHSVRGVVATLHDDIGPEVAHELERGILVEDGHRVDGLEAGEDIGAIGFAADGAIGALETPNARVAVDTDDERIPPRARAAKKVEMSGMQQVEDTVGEDDASVLAFAPRAGARPVEDLARGIEVGQKVLSTRGSKWISRTYSGSSTRS